MTETIIVAVLSLTGTAIGSIVSVITANRLTNYKIEELQKEVEKHNKVIERTFALERRCDVFETKIENLEKGAKK